MLDDFKRHYSDVNNIVESKLKEFEEVCEKGDWLEELTFCIFAANSSAEMGMKAVNLLKPVLKNGSLEDYKKAVYKKVRFYNIRSEYLYYNKKFFENDDFKNLLVKLDFYERRKFLVNNIKGFGYKEASHFLRNVGFKGYCIIDKHILRLMNELNAFESNTPPKNEIEYYNYERLMKRFAENNGFDVDALDLALWSYATGKIIK